MGITYKDAGVDVTAGYDAVRLMKSHIGRTLNDCVMEAQANFGGLYALPDSDRILVAGADGVGTKLKLAFIQDKHDTIGIDAVAMCVNDVVCHGAQPLFFLDYIASPRVEPARIAQIVQGMAEGCVQAGCALLGGETAEMPGFYAHGEYDVAGFAVGMVHKDALIDGSRTRPGDVLIGLASSGVHSNGFSLIRHLYVREHGDPYVALNQPIEQLGCTLAEELLKPTRIYVKTVLQLMRMFDIHGCAHITGGGFVENIPRILPKGLGARIRRGSFSVPPIFEMLREDASMTEESIYNTFNMGIGMVLCVSPKEAAACLGKANQMGEAAYIIGRVAESDTPLELCDEA